MKRLFKNILSMLAMSSMVLLYSCGGDDEPAPPAAPTIAISAGQFASSTSATASVGDMITITANIDAPGGFNNLTFDIKHDATGQSILDPGPITESRAAGTTETTRTFNYTSPALPLSFGGQNFTLTLTVVDDNNNTTTGTYTLAVAAEPIDVYDAFMLPAPLADLSAENFFSTNNGTVYSAATVVGSQDPLSQNIDFGYYYGATDMASLASPAGFETTVFATQVANWGTKNSTTLLSTTMTEADFNEIDTSAEIETAFAAGTGGAEIKSGLSVGDVIAFQTGANKPVSPGKKGLIYVKAINGTFNQGDNIEIRVVVQK